MTLPILDEVASAMRNGVKSSFVSSQSCTTSGVIIRQIVSFTKMAESKPLNKIIPASNCVPVCKRLNSKYVR